MPEKISRTRTPLTGDAARLNSALSMALLLSGINTRDALAKSAGISPLTISSSIKRGRFYRGIADQIKPLLTISEEIKAAVLAALESGSGYTLIEGYVSEAPSGLGFNKALFEQITALKATFNAVVKLNKFANTGDFIEKTGFDCSFLDTGFIPQEVFEELQSIVVGKNKSLQYLGALEDFIGAPEEEEEETETEDI